PRLGVRESSVQKHDGPGATPLPGGSPRRHKRQRGSVAAAQVPARSNRDRAFQLPSSALASCRFLCAQLPIEPGFREIPLPENSPGRDAEHFSRFLETQSTEKAQLYDLALAWVDDGQTLKGF